MPPLYALEAQQPWADYLVTGHKRVETRAYRLPEQMLNGPVLVITKHPTSGMLRGVGWVRFSGCRQYLTRQQWASETALHLVPSDEAGPFGWHDADCKFAWDVRHCEPLAKHVPLRSDAVEKLFRSVYLLVDPPPSAISKL
jgi:hypothetical protein